MNSEVYKGNIIIATPNINFAEGLKTHLKKKNFKINDVVVDIEHLMESLQKLHGEGIIVNAIILTSDIGKKLDDKRLEHVSDTLIQIREKFSNINMVLMANEKAGHPFLAEVVQMGIYNVFIKGNEGINIDLLEEVIDKPKTFAYAASYLNVNSEYRWRDKATSIKTVPNQHEEKKQVIKKEIVKKEVNKQVVKRNYHINVQNNVEKVVGVPIDKKLILVGSPFSRSGSTFFSHLLARGLAKIGVSVTYIESPYTTAYSYDRFIGHDKNPDYRSKFYQYTKEIDPKKPSVFEWTLEDIQLVTKHPSNEPIYDNNEVPFEVYVKILLASQTTVTIVDVGTDWDKEIYRDIRDIAARSYLVIEPDISNIQFLEDPDSEGSGLYREMIDDEKTGLIGNRFDENILKNELIKKLYKEKLETIIPAFPSKDVFKCQYDGTFINDMKIYDKQISDMLHPIYEELLPRQFINKYKKKSGLFNGLFNKKYSIERSDG